MRIALIALLLAGCATPEQRAARAIERYAPFCEKLGFKANTDPWRQCIQQQADSDFAQRSAASRAIIQQMNRPRTCMPVGSSVVCQ